MFKCWRATVGRFFAWLGSAEEQRLIRESFIHPTMKRTGRETIKYYEKGQSTTITCDLALGRKDLDLLIYNKLPLRWSDTGEALTSEESKRVYSNLSDLLASQKIRWAYSETVKS